MSEFPTFVDTFIGTAEIDTWLEPSGLTLAEAVVVAGMSRTPPAFGSAPIVSNPTDAVSHLAYVTSLGGRPGSVPSVDPPVAKPRRWWQRRK